jgi:hypothetical protein
MRISSDGVVTIDYPRFVEAREGLETCWVELLMEHEDHVDMIPYDDLDSAVQDKPESPFDAPQNRP